MKDKKRKILLPVGIIFILVFSFGIVFVQVHASSPPPQNDGLVWDVTCSVGQTLGGFNALGPTHNGGTLSSQARIQSEAASQAGALFAIAVYASGGNTNEQFYWNFVGGVLKITYGNNGASTVTSNYNPATFLADRSNYYNFTLQQDFTRGFLSSYVNGVLEDNITTITSAAWNIPAAGGGITAWGLLEGGGHIRFDAWYTSVNGGTISGYGYDFQTSSLPTTPANWSNSCSLTSLQDSNALSGGTQATATTVTTTTLTQTEKCYGICPPGSISSGGYYIPTNTIMWVQAKSPVNTVGFLTNMTTKLKAVHINAATGTIWLVFYTSNGVPSSTNPFLLQYSISETVTNGTTNILESVNPASTSNVQVCSLCYMAIGIIATTTKSNSATVGGSGVQVYLTSLYGIITTAYGIFGSVIPPQSFYGGQTPNPSLYEFAKVTYPVQIFSTTTTLVSTATSTTTTTATIMSTDLINQVPTTQPNNWFAPMFYVMLVFALFSGFGMVLSLMRRQ